MDNQTHNSEGAWAAWIDERLAALAPSGNWHPDGRCALAEHLKRRDQPQAAVSPRWVQLSMAGAVLLSIGFVVTLLPWHALWEGPKPDRKLQTETPKAATPPVPVPEPVPSEVVTKPAPVPTPVTPGSPQPLVVAAVTEVQQPAEPSPDPEQKSPERVGPGVTPPLVVPSTRADPEYTDEARAARIQGTVVLSVTIRADGTGRVEQVVRSLDPGLDQKAIEAFQKWRFTPGMKDGKPVDVQLQVVFNFKLY